MDTDNRFTFDLILFERCNLKCRHCYQHNSGQHINWEIIDTVPQTIDKCLSQVLKNKPNITTVPIGICGGELFVDGYSDAYFDRYQSLVDQINNVVNNFGLHTSIEFVTNGVFRNKHRVEKLIANANSKISISYDPVFRYNSDLQKQCALNNISYFHERGLLHEVSITLTKQSIDYYVDNDDLKQFARVPIGICYYVLSTNGNENLIANDQDIYKFFKYCHDQQYYNVRAYFDLVQSVRNNTKFKFCHCDNRIIIRNGIPSNNCVAYATDFSNKDFYKTQNVNWHNIAFVRDVEGQYKRGCLNCQYNNFCPGICATSILHNAVKLTDNCPHKRLIQLLIDEKNNSNNPIL